MRHCCIRQIFPGGAAAQPQAGDPGTAATPLLTVPMHYALLVPVVVATVVGGGAGTWTGQVDLEVDVRDGYTWGIVPRLRNGNAQAARGYVLTLALQNQNHDAIQIVPMTNAVVDSSRSNVGVWSVRPRDAFRLPSGESYSSTAVSVIFHGPLWGTAGCVDASWLHAHVTFLADPTIGSICGDGYCRCTLWAFG